MPTVSRSRVTRSWPAVIEHVNRTVARLLGDPYETCADQFSFDTDVPTTTLFGHWVTLRVRGSYRRIDPAAFRAHRMLEPERQAQFLEFFYTNFLEPVMSAHNYFIAYGYEELEPGAWE